MFDRYVSSQDRLPPATRALIILLVVAGVVHVLAVIGVIIWSFFYVQEVAPPPLTITFIKPGAFAAAAAAAPKLGSDGDAGKPKPRPSTPKPKQVKPQTPVTQPITQPTKIT